MLLLLSYWKANLAQASACCRSGWMCDTNFLCMHPTSSIRAIGTCTDKTWHDEECPLDLSMGPFFHLLSMSVQTAFGLSETYNHQNLWREELFSVWNGLCTRRFVMTILYARMRTTKLVVIMGMAERRYIMTALWFCLVRLSSCPLTTAVLAT